MSLRIVLEEIGVRFLFNYVGFTNIRKIGRNQSILGELRQKSRRKCCQNVLEKV